MTARVPVCVFAKPPRPGVSKTRIGDASGHAFAARLAAALFADTWSLVASLSWARPVLATTTRDLAPFGLAGPVEVWLQGDGDLGARMERILARSIDEAGRGIVVGADLPGLPRDRLTSARDALDHHDAVLGPARDGGFYLLGMRRVPAGALAELPWSTAETLACTERRMSDLGICATRIAPWFDLDVPADLVPARAALETCPFDAPRTLEVLRSLDAP